MIIIGADCHPSFQQIAWVDTDTGEFEERRLQHREEAETFYRELNTQGDYEQMKKFGSHAGEPGTGDGVLHSTE